MAKEFLDFLKEQDHPEQRHPAVREMNKFVSQVSEFVGKPAKCELILGQLVKQGQEYRVVLVFQELSYAQTLLRVYIPMGKGSVKFLPGNGKTENVKASVPETALISRDSPLHTAHSLSCPHRKTQMNKNDVLQQIDKQLDLYKAEAMNYAWVFLQMTPQPRCEGLTPETKAGYEWHWECAKTAYAKYEALLDFRKTIEAQ